MAFIDDDSTSASPVQPSPMPNGWSLTKSQSADKPSVKKKSCEGAASNLNNNNNNNSNNINNSKETVLRKNLL